MKCFARVHNLAQVCYTHCVWWILNAHQLIFKSHFEFLNSLHWWYVQYAKTKADLESFISRRIERRSERVLSVVEYHDDGWWRKRADNTDKYSHCNVLNASFTRHPSVVRRTWTPSCAWNWRHYRLSRSIKLARWQRRRRQWCCDTLRQQRNLSNIEVLKRLE